MKLHWKYLKYVLRHKWLFIKSSRRFDIPLWRAIAHDLSKFSKAEWLPYAQNFFWTDEQKNDESWDKVGEHGGIWEAIPYGELVQDRFRIAVNHHYHSNPHHWNYWLTYDATVSEKPWALPMPDIYIREMVADWSAVGLAINGNPNPSDWYDANKEKMILRYRTRRSVEELLRLF